jgi:hypothetical protein
MMADDIQDIADYRDAIENLLLNGEELEAAFPASTKTQSDSDEPQAIAITSHRLVVCHRRLRSGTYDRWTFRSILFSRVEQVELYREEQFRRDRIDPQASVTLYLSRQESGSTSKLELRYLDSAMAREVHDRILAHLLTVEARGLP